MAKPMSTRCMCGFCATMADTPPSSRPPSRWSARGADGAEYDQRFAALAATGKEMHGEVAFIERFAPNRVLDAGCGTGRVAIELFNRGIEVVGTDLDESMLAQARKKEPAIEWVLADLASLELDDLFDVVALPGNVMIFLLPGTEAAVVERLVEHLLPGGYLIAGFQLNGVLQVGDYDQFCFASGLEFVDRFATWDGEPFQHESKYAVSVHRLPVAVST